MKSIFGGSGRKKPEFFYYYAMKKLPAKEFRQKLIATASQPEKDLGDLLKKYFMSQNYHWWHNSIVGPYFIDWYCQKAKIGVEMDGSHHFKSKEKIAKDIARDKYLREEHGITIIRVTPWLLYNDKNKLIGVIQKKMYHHLIGEVDPKKKKKKKLSRPKQNGKRSTQPVNGHAVQKNYRKAKANWY